MDSDLFGPRFVWRQMCDRLIVGVAEMGPMIYTAYSQFYLCIYQTHDNNATCLRLKTTDRGMQHSLCLILTKEFLMRRTAYFSSSRDHYGNENNNKFLSVQLGSTFY